jgi:hypothetical protein
MVFATTMSPERYSAEHIDQWSILVASCEVT